MFLGYSSIYLGYKCLSLQTNKLYISRDMIFDEDTLPLSFDPHTQTLTTRPDDILGSHPLAIPINTPILISPSTPPNSYYIPLTLGYPSLTSHDTTSTPATPMPPLPALVHTPTSPLKPSIKFFDPFVAQTTPPLTPNQTTDDTSPPLKTRTLEFIYKITPKALTISSKYPLPQCPLTQASSIEPTSFAKASTNPHWREAMSQEFKALCQNNT